MRKLQDVVRLLVTGDPLPTQYHNHKLSGKYRGCEECHIESNWLLIYEHREDMLILHLLRTGRHTDLFDE